MKTPIEHFGKDHWSLLAYAESTCVNGTEGFGNLSSNRMRCNKEKHPLLSSGNNWKTEYSTRLKGFFEFPDRSDAEKAIQAGVMIEGHDDWDCLNDLDEAGLIEIKSLVNGSITMTKKGMELTNKIREHKCEGGSFSNFNPTD